jgi:hypothetical protein
MDKCCSDSPLSVAGNVVGFLTFVLAVIAWWIALIAATRGALQEIQVCSDNLTIAIDQIQSMLDYCREQVRSKDAIFAQMNVEFTTSLQQSVVSATELKDDLAIHLEAFGSGGGIFGWKLGSRLSWVSARGEIDRRMAKLLAKKADLVTFQLILALRSVLPSPNSSACTLLNLVGRWTLSYIKLRHDTLLCSSMNE